MTTHVQVVRGSVSGGQVSKQFSKKPVLSEACQAGYKRSASQAVVHQMIEGLVSFSSMSRFLARIFENFNGIDSISLCTAKNGHLEHSLTLAKRSDRIYIRCNEEKVD